MSITQPIRASRNDETHIFPSLRQCALFFEKSSHVISQALAFGEKVDGWSFERDDSYSLREFIRHSDAVIGTTPKGEHIRFATITEAAEILHCSAAAIKAAIKRKNKRYGNWEWSVNDGTIEAVEPTNFLCSSFTLRGDSGRRAASKAPPAEVEEVDPYAGREVLATGFFDEDYGMTQCPFCANIIMHDRKMGDFSGHKHLTQCLAGYDWEVKFNIIKVYKP